MIWNHTLTCCRQNTVNKLAITKTQREDCSIHYFGGSIWNQNQQSSTTNSKIPKCPNSFLSYILSNQFIFFFLLRQIIYAWFFTFCVKIKMHCYCSSCSNTLCLLIAQAFTICFVYHENSTSHKTTGLTVVLAFNRCSSRDCDRLTSLWTLPFQKLEDLWPHSPVFFSSSHYCATSKQRRRHSQAKVEKQVLKEPAEHLVFWGVIRLFTFNDEQRRIPVFLSYTAPDSYHLLPHISPSVLHFTPLLFIMSLFYLQLSGVLHCSIVMFSQQLMRAKWLGGLIN